MLVVLAFVAPVIVAVAFVCHYYLMLFHISFMLHNHYGVSAAPPF